MNPFCSAATIVQSMQRSNTRFLLVVVMAFSVLAARYATPVHAHRLTPPVVPPIIAVPTGNTPFLVGPATGTQNYTCTTASTWGSAAPLGRTAHLLLAVSGKMGSYTKGGET